MDVSDIIFHLVVICAHLVQSELICLHQPIVALPGDDVILPCHLEPAADADSWRVEWTKPDLNPKYIHVHEDGRLLYQIQNPSYFSRTRLFVDELMNGNVSMKIFRVKLSDEGKYRCFIPSIQKEAFVQLTVGSVSSPVIEVLSNGSRRVELQCESKGWYPEPEVLWLDAEGNLLSAGPTETVRGPDDLYTVSSRVTVEKRHSNSFTCRVQQKDINQTRETHIYVPGLSWSENLALALGLTGVFLCAVFTVCAWKLGHERGRMGRLCLQQQTAETENQTGGEASESSVRNERAGEETTHLSDSEADRDQS